MRAFVISNANEKWIRLSTFSAQRLRTACCAMAARLRAAAPGIYERMCKFALRRYASAAGRLDAVATGIQCHFFEEPDLTLSHILRRPDFGEMMWPSLWSSPASRRCSLIGGALSAPDGWNVALALQSLPLEA